MSQLVLVRQNDAHLTAPLPRRMFAALRNIAEAIFFGPHGAPAAERLDWLSRELDDFLAHAGARTRFVIRLSVLAVCIAAPLSIGRFRRFSALSLSDRVRALDRLERGSLSAPLLAVKALISVLYYEHPDAQREVGFDARCASQARRQ